jgi:hypothetical protein
VGGLGGDTRSTETLPSRSEVSLRGTGAKVRVPLPLPPLLNSSSLPSPSALRLDQLSSLLLFRVVMMMCMMYSLSLSAFAVACKRYVTLVIQNSLQGGLPTKPLSVLRSLDNPTRIAKQRPRQLWSNLHRYILNGLAGFKLCKEVGLGSEHAFGCSSNPTRTMSVLGRVAGSKFGALTPAKRALDCVEFWASSGDKDEQDACDPRPEDRHQPSTARKKGIESASNSPRACRVNERSALSCIEQLFMTMTEFFPG